MGDIARHLKEDTGATATLMVDYYALPHNWPGRDAAGTVDQKYSALVSSIELDFEAKTGIAGRFVAFVMMHEFEALLFSDCTKFAESLGFDSKAALLEEIRQQFESPEHINDSPITAPSKRVVGLIAQYDKVLFGNVAAHEIGLQKICEECPNFRAWITRLEGLNA